MNRVMLLVSLIFLSAGYAAAADGVLEINQTCATATSGCFAGDAGGFPVRISQPGSYRLTGNLTVPANTTAIRIESSHVSLDLGGFEVRGPNTCTGYPPSSCTQQDGAAGILSPTTNEFLVKVHNGVVFGMAGPCINLAGNSAIVEDVSVYYCGQGIADPFAGAITIGDHGRVSSSHSSNSTGSGIRLGDKAAAVDNEVLGHKHVGIVAPLAPQGGLMMGNRVFDVPAGFFASSSIPSSNRYLVSKNVVVAATPMTGGTRSAGDNLCNGLLC